MLTNIYLDRHHKGPLCDVFSPVWVRILKCGGVQVKSLSLPGLSVWHDRVDRDHASRVKYRSWLCKHNRIDKKIITWDFLTDRPGVKTVAHPTIAHRQEKIQKYVVLTISIKWYNRWAIVRWATVSVIRQVCPLIDPFYSPHLPFLRDLIPSLDKGVPICQPDSCADTHPHYPATCPSAHKPTHLS